MKMVVFCGAALLGLLYALHHWVTSQTF